VGSRRYPGRRDVGGIAVAGGLLVAAITVDVIAAVFDRRGARKEVTRMTKKTSHGLVVPVVMSVISSLLVNLAATAACTGR
jgi:hypothetical protein